MPGLFDPLTIGALTLPNRIVMAPLTRARCGPERVPGPMVAAHYARRATAGLILSEATSVMPMGVGYDDTPGIWSQDQMVGWKLVTDAVHRAGGRIFLQLWHVGRISDPALLGGALPVAPSAIAARGTVSLLRPKRAFVTPRALDLDDIAGIVRAYRHAAENALRAGFDGVELHGANGYLPDQFLQDGTNHRTDRYGGSLEGRARFMIEVVDELIAVWGADRVGLHIAPRADSNDMGDSDLRATFDHVARSMRARKIAFIFAREEQGDGRIGPQLKAAFGGSYIADQGLTPTDGETLIARGEADAVSFGRAFIANPDLVARIRRGGALAEADPATFYHGGAVGYGNHAVESAA